MFLDQSCDRGSGLVAEFTSREWIPRGMLLDHTYSRVSSTATGVGFYRNGSCKIPSENKNTPYSKIFEFGSFGGKKVVAFVRALHIKLLSNLVRVRIMGQW
jgi:hypothetical protein